MKSFHFLCWLITRAFGRPCLQGTLTPFLHVSVNVPRVFGHMEDTVIPFRDMESMAVNSQRTAL